MKTNKFFLGALALTIGITAIVSCGSDDAAASLPPIGGFNSADEVAAADLVAYWPLNGTGVESKSNTAPSTSVGASWETGAKGQGLKLNNGYLKYPNIAGLTSTLSAYTISAWIKVSNNKTAVAGSGTVSSIFSMTRNNEWIGNLNLYAETGRYLTTIDTLIVKQGFGSSVSGTQIYESLPKLEPWMISDNLVTPGKHVANANKNAGRWTHVLATWSGADNKFIIYANGQKISNPAFEVRGTNTSLVLDAPTMPIIGAFGNFATTSDTWNTPMTGNVDEIRVYKKALTLAEIGALYELEKVGR
jgi:hypothetical protein